MQPDYPPCFSIVTGPNHLAVLSGDGSQLEERADRLVFTLDLHYEEDNGEV